VLKVMRTKHPYLRILVISGYLHGTLLQAATLLGATAALQKPLTADVLVKKVKEVLGR
jgi:DNA-binding NarL/FixJ family response regulator